MSLFNCQELETYDFKEGDVGKEQELYVYWYLKELYEEGWIDSITYHPDPFLLCSETKRKYIKSLKTKDKEYEKKLLGAHVYTADFLVGWKGINKLPLHCLWSSPVDGYFLTNGSIISQWRKNTILDDVSASYIEVKSSPVYNTRNISKSAVEFPINQKWVFSYWGIYVQRIIPVIKKGNLSSGVIYSGLFPDTFVPKRYLMTDTGRQERKINFKIRTLKEYVENKNP